MSFGIRHTKHVTCYCVKFGDIQLCVEIISSLPQNGILLPVALRAAQACRYSIYSEADFEVFRPAGATRCTDGGEIWHGGGGDLRSPPPCQISPPIGATTRV